MVASSKMMFLITEIPLRKNRNIYDGAIVRANHHSLQQLGPNRTKVSICQVFIFAAEKNRQLVL